MLLAARYLRMAINHPPSKQRYFRHEDKLNGGRFLNQAIRWTKMGPKNARPSKLWMGATPRGIHLISLAFRTYQVLLAENKVVWRQHASVARSRRLDTMIPAGLRSQLSLAPMMCTRKFWHFFWAFRAFNGSNLL